MVKRIKTKYNHYKSLKRKLDKFNSDYGLDLHYYDRRIDLDDTPFRRSLFLLIDFCRLPFYNCEKLIVPSKVMNLKYLKPSMNKLRILDISECDIQKLELDSDYFSTLEIIFLNDNKINNYDDLLCLKTFKNLEKIYVYNNPISKNKNEIDKLSHELPNIEIIYEVIENK